jgi:cellulose synthase/poly-beta-1,6-N-acetylglucosamine synthase-like glycosyltransferase
MVSYFTDDVGMVVGFSQLGNKGKAYSLFEKLQALDFLSLMAAAQGSLNLNCPLAASGQNIGYRRSAFDAVGGFEKIKHRISGDDVLLLQLIRKYTDWKISFAPSPAAFNWAEPEKTLKSFLNQRKRWASNGTYQIKLNSGFFFFIVSVFLMNLIVIFGTAFYIFIYHSITIPILSLLVKFFIELLITLKGALIYQRADLLKYFPIWAIVQMPYVIFTGLMGSLGRFIWKDRRFFQVVTTFRRG